MPPEFGPDREYCQVEAREAGTDWRRTALSRLLRRGAILRYKFAAVTDPAANGRRGIAAWCEFSHEARKNMRLDELDPEGPGVPGLSADARAAVGANLNDALDALKHLDWLLSQRGWETDKPAPGQARRPWYATRYSRRAILFD